jgi:hypothetical protein
MTPVVVYCIDRTPARHMASSTWTISICSGRRDGCSEATCHTRERARGILAAGGLDEDQRGDVLLPGAWLRRVAAVDHAHSREVEAKERAGDLRDGGQNLGEAARPLSRRWRGQMRSRKPFPNKEVQGHP